MNAFITIAALTFFRIDAYSPNPHMPDERPADAVESESFSAAAARGEFESVSFLALPEADLERVDFKFSDLKEPDGAVIPASAIDLKSVKVWFQPDGLWLSFWCGNRHKPTAIPTLVLHDDSLVKVDWEKKQNLLRFDYPGNSVYKRISGGDVDDRMNYGVEPVADAKSFVPFDLAKGRYQQYWMTYKVPKDAKPGVYRGTATVTSAGKRLKDLALDLEVYPFTLPLARTHYDSSRPYMISMDNGVHLADLLRECHDLKAAEAKALATYRMCAEHNLLYLAGPGFIAQDNPDDLALRMLYLMREAGMPLRPLFAGRTEDGGGNCAVMGKTLDRILGHNDAYYYGWDEAPVEGCLKQYETWSRIKMLGGRIHAAYADVNACGWSIDCARAPCLIATSEARDWHADGAIVMSYAAPFTGPDCPAIWRHTKGLRFWYADFDGINDYVFYYHNRNRWNEFIRSPDGYRCFGIVCPAKDAMIGTVAFEALREGVDDVRYLSLMKLRAEAAMASKDTSVALLGKRAIAWIDSRDPERLGPLDGFRKEVVGWIGRLVAAVGPQPEEPELKPLGTLPPHSVDRMAADESIPIEKRAIDCAAANRYDLAIPFYARLRGDKSLSPATRARHALREAELRLVMLDRPGAVAAIEDAIAAEPPDDIVAGLRLAKANAIISQVGFREEFSPAMLQVAEKEFDELFSSKARGALSAQERFGLIWRLAKAHLSSSEPMNARAFADAAIAKYKLTDSQKGTLFYCGVKALERTGRGSEAYELLKKVHSLKGCDLSGSDKLIAGELGFYAEELGEYDKAQVFFAEALSRWSPLNDNHYPRFKSALIRVTKRAREMTKDKMVERDGMAGGAQGVITLDEEP